MQKVFQKYVADVTAVAAVEFVIIAPILILLLIGTVDIGFYIIERMQVQNTAHATAEYVALSQSDAGVQTVAEESYGRDIQNLNVTSEFSCECADGQRLECPVDCGETDFQRRFVEVSVTGDFSTIFPYPGVPDEITLNGYARMRVD